jgi:hypothetical protein
MPHMSIPDATIFSRWPKAIPSLSSSLRPAATRVDHVSSASCDIGPMGGAWNGSIVYEWVEEANHYGLVNNTHGPYSGAPIPI